MTTTTTVGFLSMQPWLIPVLARYGLISVGIPLFMMRKARVKWEETTEVLTNGYQEGVGDDEDHDTASTIDSGSKVGQMMLIPYKRRWERRIRWWWRRPMMGKRRFNQLYHRHWKVAWRYRLLIAS